MTESRSAELTDAGAGRQRVPSRRRAAHVPQEVAFRTLWNGPISGTHHGGHVALSGRPG
jgi:hypothetical protein